MKQRSTSPTAADEARRMTRLHQMELMEAAARGTRPSYNLTTKSSVPKNTTDLIHARNAAIASQFLVDDDYDYFEETPSGAAITSSGDLFMAETIFDQPVDQSVNIREFHRSSSFLRTSYRASFVDMFVGGSTTHAEPGEQKDTSRAKNVAGKCLVLGMLLLFGTVLVTSVGFLFQDPNGALLAKPRPQTLSEFVGLEQTGERMDDMKNLLLLHRAAPVAAFQRKSSPAAMALQWLSDTDPAQLPVDGTHEEELLSRFALASLFYATNPVTQVMTSRGHRDTAQVDVTTRWIRSDKWMSASTVCEWYGVECDENEQTGVRTVRHVNLTMNNLMGTLPLELRSLSNMVRLDLSHNKLAGSLPTPLLRILTLGYFLLNHNALKGTIPDGISFLEAAQEINLSNNQLTSSIPASISRLKMLRVLDISHNNLDGPIPDLSGVVAMNNLYLNNNKFSGKLPISISHLTNLYDLRLDDNVLTGTIPPGLESNRRLRRLYLGNNQLSGRIPDIFDDLHRLTDLDLHNNRFQSQLPSSMQYLTSLRRLSIDSSGMTGTLPAEWGQMTDLEALIMDYNSLKGPIPTSFGKMTNLRMLLAGHNFLQGELPSEIGELSQLKELLLDNNSIRGALPSELGRLSNLKTLQVFKSMVNGTMPEEVCALKPKGLKTLEADCKKRLKCECCTKCH